MGLSCVRAPLEMQLSPGRLWEQTPGDLSIRTHPADCTGVEQPVYSTVCVEEDGVNG